MAHIEKSDFKNEKDTEIDFFVDVFRTDDEQGRFDITQIRQDLDRLTESYQEHNHTLFDGTRLIDEIPTLSPLVKSLLFMGG